MATAWKKSRLAHNLEQPPSAELAEAIAKVEELRQKNRERAEKWGIAYTEPNLATLGADVGLSKTDYLRLTRQVSAGETTGFDATAEEEQERREARAKRFDIPTFTYEAERAKIAGLSDEEVRLRKERRERAARFGVADPIDVEIARAAREALADFPQYDPEAMPEVRGNALHMRAFKYLPAASGDIIAFFAPIKPAFVEWLNGHSLNVLFEDEGTAKRALELTAEPIPSVPGVEAVKDCWRVCLKPLVKQVTDKYAPAGATTTIYLRHATSEDTREKADASVGPKLMGTYSKEGDFSLRKHGISTSALGGHGGAGASSSPRAPVGSPQGGDADMLVIQPGSTKEPQHVDPKHVASAVTGALREIASHVSSALAEALPEKWPPPPPQISEPMPAAGGATRVVEVKKRSGNVHVTLNLPERDRRGGDRSGHREVPTDASAGPARTGPIVVQKRADRVAAAAGAGASNSGPVVVKTARGRGRDRAAELGVTGSGAGAGAAMPSRLGKRKARHEDEAEGAGGYGYDGRYADEDERRARAEAEEADAEAAGGATGAGAGRSRDDDNDLLAALDAEEAAAVAAAGAGSSLAGAGGSLAATQPLTQLSQAGAHAGQPGQGQGEGSNLGQAVVAGFADLGDDDL